MIVYTVEVYEDGSRNWYLNGKRHREGGPAVEYNGGYKAWYLNGNRHREDGPAAEHRDGDKSWWLNGKRLTEEEHQAATNPVKELTIAELEAKLGYKIKVVGEQQ